LPPAAIAKLNSIPLNSSFLIDFILFGCLILPSLEPPAVDGVQSVSTGIDLSIGIV
jgi:hypothetical protein